MRQVDDFTAVNAGENLSSDTPAKRKKHEVGESGQS